MTLIVKESSPLVSIVVISYNSTKYIVELLDSVNCQSYKNIELIISDDASKDDTLEKVNLWVDLNKKRFQRVSILESKKNLGICKNINRGVKAASGDWIKPIAGDDVLLNDCIAANLAYALDNSLEILFSKPDLIYENDIPDFYIKQLNRRYQESVSIFLLPAKKQFLHLLHTVFVCPPTLFISRMLLERMNYFNEDIKFSEDLPFYLKITHNNIKLNLFNQETVKYRLHSKSAGHLNRGFASFDGVLYKEKKKLIMRYIDLKFMFEHPLHFIQISLDFFSKDLIVIFGNNRLVSIIFRSLMLFSPLFVIKQIKGIYSSFGFINFDRK